MTEREAEVLALVARYPTMSQQEMAKRLGISRSSLAGHIMNLTRQGRIQGKGYIVAPKRYVVVVGGANMDICGRARIPLSGADSTPSDIFSGFGGVGRNIAENLARLGTDCRLITAVGNDMWGDKILEHCRDLAINTEFSITVKEASTSCFVSILDSDGEVSQAVNDMAVLDHLTPDALEKCHGVLSCASLIVVDANLSEATLSWIFARYRDTPIFADPVSATKCQKLKPHLGNIDTLKPNRAEAAMLAGIPEGQPGDLAGISCEIHNLGVRHVVISLGRDGIWSSMDGNGVHIPAIEGNGANVTGCGDALMAGLVHARSNNWPREKTLQFAVAAASLAREADTAVNPLISESSVFTCLKDACNED
ncbi:PfkB family carbohydrate kinase [Parasalinivibrio latis]|uniref:PfkB family carbohydrate kinase n=1 Tax=Parasalinivibrio latis TaxID=2952610 RepID=UPI0030E2AB78